jgi:hypothetical protein
MKKLALLPLVPLVPLVFASLAFAQQPSTTQGWAQSQETDSARGYNFTRYTLSGKFLTPSPIQAANRPALAVDCIPAGESPRGQGTLLAGNLLVGTNLKIKYVESEEIPSGITGISYFPKIAVQYRIDNEKREEKHDWSPTSAMTEDQWSPGSDKKSASIPKHSLEEILRARKVAITTYDDHGRKIVVRFDMPDATLVEQGCNVDER